MSPADTTGLSFPFPEPPAKGGVLEIAPGVLWFRMPLPSRLDHVNIFLLEDNDGWVVIDTGLANDLCKDAWIQLLSGPMAGERISKVVVTHHHPDHAGLAGWLCERLDVPLLMGQMSYLALASLTPVREAVNNKVLRDFYARNGASADLADAMSTSGNVYFRMISPLPSAFMRLTAGEQLGIGDRTFRVMTGEGHAAEQVMLHSVDDKVFIAADQVIEKINPNISVWVVDPDGDPLGLYLSSLEAITREIDDDVLVLSGHRRPFVGLHQRCGQIAESHADRLAVIREATMDRERTTVELVPQLYPRPLDPHQLSFAFGETLAYVNYLARRGKVRRVHAGDIRKVIAT